MKVAILLPLRGPVAWVLHPLLGHQGTHRVLVAKDHHGVSSEDTAANPNARRNQYTFTSWGCESRKKKTDLVPQLNGYKMTGFCRFARCEKYVAPGEDT